MPTSNGFSDSVVHEARRRAHFRCCYCRERPGDEVHHVLPKGDGGPDTIENAVLLCAQCHTTYGHNRDKRRQLQQARDHWYELAAKKYESLSPSENQSVAGPPFLSDWHEIESRFDRIRGEVWCIWSQIEQTRDVEWSAYSRDDEDDRIVPRFLAEARFAGRMVQDVPNLPRKFPGIVWTDLADAWLDAVAGMVPSKGLTGSGRDERGTHAMGSVEDVVELSRIACSRLAAEFSAPSFLATVPERTAKIRMWREMVRTIHKQSRMAKNAKRSITSLLEMHGDFLSLRPHLTQSTRGAIYGRVAIVPPDQSEMNGALHSVLKDIEALEREWGLQ